MYAGLAPGRPDEGISNPIKPETGSMGTPASGPTSYHPSRHRTISDLMPLPRLLLSARKYNLFSRRFHGNALLLANEFADRPTESCCVGEGSPQPRIRSQQLPAQENEIRLGGVCQSDQAVLTRAR